MTRVFLNRKVFFAGDVIFHEGDPGDRAYLIETGAVRITKNTRHGEVELAILSAGAIFGEMAMVDARPRMASAHAVSETTVTFVTHAMFERKMHEADPFVQALLRILVKNVRSVSEQLRQQIEAAAEQADREKS